jgi:hypothetical protein
MTPPPVNPDEFLNGLWDSMRDDCSVRAQAQAAGALVALQAVGLLSLLELEAWAIRFQHCPGHGAEGGRVWCAYCGDLEGVRP